MASDDKRIKYSDSPFAPDWAKAPEKRGDAITSFGKPIPEAEDNPHLDFGNQENSASKAKSDETADQLFKPTVEQIEEILWQDANGDINVYCIMDGYWADGLYGRLLTSDDISWAHMFQGDVATRNIQQAPFIIALKRGHKLTKWLIEEGWGRGWGIYFTASTHKAHLLYGNPRINDKRFLPSNEEQLKLGNLTKGPEDPLWKMRRHFRQFSDVYLESENKIVDFRYYDPAVFKNTILSCNNNLLDKLFACSNIFYVEHYYCEFITNKNHDFYSINYVSGRSINFRKFNLINFTYNIFNIKINETIKDKENNLFIKFNEKQCKSFEVHENIIFFEKIKDNVKNITNLKENKLDIVILDGYKYALSFKIKSATNIILFIKCFVLLGDGIKYKLKDFNMITSYSDEYRENKLYEILMKIKKEALERNQYY